jgi:hypothetical protein
MILQRYGFAASLATLLLATLLAVGPTSPAGAALIDLTPTGGVNSNTSVPLDDLLDGDVMGILVGDKIFTGFNYSRIGDMPPADDVLVLGFQDPSGNWGISFHGVFMDLPGNGASDALIRFIVEVAPEQLAQGVRISDAHIFLGGVGVGENSSFIVDESFLDLDNTMHVFKSSINGGGEQLSDWTYFDPWQEKLFVTKDILAFAADNATLQARATVIDQSFSQDVIPEPAALLLASIGLAACGLRRPRRRSV